MEDVDNLVAGLEGAFAVSDNNIHGEHPHFSDYKNEGKISEGQRARRQQFIQRQAQARDSIRDRIRFMYDKYYEVRSDDADESMDSAITTDDVRLDSGTPSIVSEHGGVDKKVSTDAKFMGAVTDGFEGMDFSKWGLPKKKGRKPAKNQHQSSQDAVQHQQHTKYGNEKGGGAVTAGGGTAATRRAQKQQQQLQASYSDTLMFSEWLVDIPPAAFFDTEWVMVPCPVGKRCLVVAHNGYTSVYNKTGYRLAQFQTEFVGGSRSSPDSYTLLDCILGKGEKKYYVLDVISWAGEQFSDKEFVARHAFLQAKFDEMPELSDPGPEGSSSTKFTFHRLPSCLCTRQAMTAFMQTDFQYPLDGLLFYYSKVYYTPGQTPLVGWLKPWMLPEILQVEIPMKFICEQGFYTDSKHFINRFNEKHRFRSSIPKSSDAESTAATAANGQSPALNDAGSEANNNKDAGMEVLVADGESLGMTQ